MPPYFDFDETFSNTEALAEIPFPPVVPMPLPFHKKRKVESEDEDDTFSYRKAPQAPKHFKSPYVCFATAHQADVKKELGENAKVPDVTQRLGEMWRSISLEERKIWDAEAEKDKARYMREKAAYKGPWKVPSKKKKKHPDAPKRPMSAFLFFSQKLRGELKAKYPEKRNTEISRMLGEMWRNAPADVREKHVRREAEEREIYKKELEDFNKRVEIEEENEKEENADEYAYSNNLENHSYYDGTAYIAPLPYHPHGQSSCYHGHYMPSMYFDQSSSSSVSDRKRNGRDSYHNHYKSNSQQPKYNISQNRLFSPIDEEPRKKHSPPREFTISMLPTQMKQPPPSPIQQEDNEHILPSYISRESGSASWEEDWRRELVYNSLCNEE